ncbi:acyl-CoA carboxylase subunit epsilon [Plantibacter sp. Mn2098]|uniref:acyl-CoA carboxylase subunit epsilon n=1 Tax=Plantibacter sp. Mn2098 TaxID=3395266 RepID=UPI003BCE3415
MTEQAATETFDIRVVRGAPTDEEIAALTAVLTAVVSQGAVDDSARDVVGQTRWQRSQRQLRTPLVPGPGRWVGYGS